MFIRDTIQEYKKENAELVNYIEKILESKKGDWDLGIKSEDELTKMLLYEYSTGIEKVTKGKMRATEVLDKLSERLGKFRLGDFRKGEDDHITYGKDSVTSHEYTKKCRIDTRFGAHTIGYEKDGKKVDSVVLFDGAQRNDDGILLSGVDLSDLTDIRHTAFHEWTHVMEKTLIPRNELEEQDMILRDGESVYINAGLSPDFTMEQYQKFIDEVGTSDEPVLFAGVSTIEINKIKSPNSRIMHNMISEGFTEKISQLIMDAHGFEIKDPTRYHIQVKVADKVLSEKGLDNGVAQYLRGSQVIIRNLESRQIEGQDALHYMNNFIKIMPDLDSYFRGRLDKETMDALRSETGAIWDKTEDEKVQFVQERLELLKKFKRINPDVAKDFLEKAVWYPELKDEFFRKVDCEFMNMNTIEEALLSGNISVEGMNRAGAKMNGQMAQVRDLTQGQSLAEAKASFQAAMAEKENEQVK